LEVVVDDCDAVYHIIVTVCPACNRLGIRGGGCKGIPGGKLDDTKILERDEDQEDDKEDGDEATTDTGTAAPLWLLVLFGYS